MASAGRGVTADDYARLKAIVAGALSRPVTDRPAYVDAQCGGDAALRAEAESLLTASVSAAPLFEDPALLVAGDRIMIDALAGVEDISLHYLPPFGDVPATAAADPFSGTDRYLVRRQIGAGGMGVVYEVDDLARSQVVALKTLRRRSGDDIYQLKQEFRNLADVAHPNLVPLYDLTIDERHCFFTMELVDGTTFVEYVRTAGSASSLADRVRRTLPQLVVGVQELHRKGLQHRDIKPSNVMVTAGGRVVILDFGLTSRRLHEGQGDREIAGTPAYLAPEQCRGETSSASDWYGVGATLYHALTGRVPFEGRPRDVIDRKAAEDPLPVTTIAPEIPADLSELCMALLRRDPAMRLSGAGVLARLSADRPVASPEVEDTIAPVFVGRESALDVLSAAFAGVKAGRSASVLIHGPSGIGKSALVQRFIDRRLSDEPVLVLRSRCHEHESIPYNGLDGIVDGLTRYLSARSSAERAQTITAEMDVLARLFPVMRAIGVAPVLDDDAADPVQLRQRAFAAFRDLLGRVAARQPIVMDIDDCQWADADSVRWLDDLLRAPSSSSLLILIAFRDEALDAAPFLRSLVERADAGARLTLPLAPMSPLEVTEMVASLLPRERADAVRPADIAHDSGGNPFLVEALARHAALGARSRAHVTLQEMLARRLEALPAESRAFLEALAVCGRPVLPARIFEACGLRGDDRPLVSRLRAAHLVRSAGDAARIEPYHDRIRETLAAGVSPDDARHIHDVMARVLVEHGDDDPEALFEHYRAAGHAALAAAQAVAAAEKASAVLAFDLAATFYRHALALQPDADARIVWSVGLAKALENAGRPVDAAESYLDAAREAAAADQLEWRRKAAELLLIGGQIDRGLAVSDAVLDAAGVRLARGPATAIASLAMHRYRLRRRGLAFDRRSDAQMAPHDLRRIDACWSITAGLAMVDPLRAADLNVRQLLWALDVGDPFRVARAVALEAGFSVIIPVAVGARRSEDLSRVALDLAGDTDYVAALTSLWAGIGVFLTGRWPDATERCGRALAILRDRCTGVTWELNLAHGFYLFSLAYRGQLREVARQVHRLSQSVRARGNFYLELELGTRLSLIRLAADEPDEAERRANDGMARWSQHGFQRPHYHHLLTLLQVRLYRGLAREAWDLLQRHERVLGQTLFRRVQHTRIEIALFRARCALAMAAAGEDAGRMRGSAVRDAARIEREHMPWSDPFARLIRATVAHQEGRTQAAIEGLTAAAAGLDAVDMQLYAAVCRRHLGVISGGEHGRLLCRDAETWMAGEDVRNPAAMSRLLAPGFPE